MTPAAFDAAVTATRMRPRAIACARAYLVEGVTNAAAIGRRYGVVAQTVREAVARVEGAYKAAAGLPPDWECLTVTVPAKAAKSIRMLERAHRRAAGLLVD